MSSTANQTQPIPCTKPQAASQVLQSTTTSTAALPLKAEQKFPTNSPQSSQHTPSIEVHIQHTTQLSHSKVPPTTATLEVHQHSPQPQKVQECRPNNQIPVKPLVTPPPPSVVPPPLPAVASTNAQIPLHSSPPPSVKPPPTTVLPHTSNNVEHQVTARHPSLIFTTKSFATKEPTDSDTHRAPVEHLSVAIEPSNTFHFGSSNCSHTVPSIVCKQNPKPTSILVPPPITEAKNLAPNCAVSETDELAASRKRSHDTDSDDDLDTYLSAQFQKKARIRSDEKPSKSKVLLPRILPSLPPPSEPEKKKIVVVDTNVLLVELQIVKNIFKFPWVELKVPSIVIGELDSQKNKPDISVQSRAASAYIQLMFSSGMKPVDFIPHAELFMTHTYHNNMRNDEIILNTCLYYRRKNHTNLDVVLLTKDINLQILAKASDIMVMGAQQFYEKFCQQRFSIGGHTPSRSTSTISRSSYCQANNSNNNRNNNNNCGTTTTHSYNAAPGNSAAATPHPFAAPSAHVAVPHSTVTVIKEAGHIDKPKEARAGEREPSSSSSSSASSNTHSDHYHPSRRRGHYPAPRDRDRDNHYSDRDRDSENHHSDSNHHHERYHDRGRGFHSHQDNKHYKNH
ncbi:hypothetical protein Pelo_16214 [Pelomyxa schiedti]|nr:hypothetical protein Pelo_16214 [Pelomyxa schiedti]